MSEERNPYIQSEPAQGAQPENFTPQNPWSTQQAAQTQYQKQYQKTEPPQPQPQRQQAFQPMPFQPQAYVYPPQPTNAQRVNYRAYEAQKSSDSAAKVFGVVSFIIGCFALMVTSMIYFNFRSTVTQKFNYALTWGMILSLPSIIFGVVSLMKKSKKKIFAVMGIAFAAVLLIAAFVTYFFMVNSVPEATQVHRYY